MIGATDANGHPTYVIESHGRDATAEVVPWPKFMANLSAQGKHIDSYGRDEQDDFGQQLYGDGPDSINDGVEEVDTSATTSVPISI
jgi:hypothetical protein